MQHNIKKNGKAIGGIFMVVKTKEDEKLFKKAIEAQENLLKKH